VDIASPAEIFRIRVRRQGVFPKTNSRVNQMATLAAVVVAIGAWIPTSSARKRPQPLQLAGRGAAPGGSAAECNLSFDPNGFATRTENELFPLEPGRLSRFRENSEHGVVTIIQKVTGRTNEILGVTTTVVKGVERFKGRRTELNFAWYAPDSAGNVWYLGEDNFEYDKGKSVSKKGSWEAGVDGAQGGIIINAAPQVTDSNRQECYEGKAEDMYWVVATGERKSVPYGEFEDVVRILEWSPLEPEVVAAKFYAPGIGLIAERDLGSKARVELVEVVNP
jgi:hypothetical protein